MNETEKRKKIVDIINSIYDYDVYDVIELHNCYCKAAGHEEQHIYEMKDFEEALDSVDKRELFRMILLGAFDSTKDFWSFNGYGNIDSYNAWELPIYAGDIAYYILSAEDSLGNDEIQEILDEEEEDNEF